MSFKNTVLITGGTQNLGYFAALSIGQLLFCVVSAAPVLETHLENELRLLKETTY